MGRGVGVRTSAACVCISKSRNGQGRGVGARTPSGVAPLPTSQKAQILTCGSNMPNDPLPDMEILRLPRSSAPCRVGLPPPPGGQLFDPPYLPTQSPWYAHGMAYLPTYLRPSRNRAAAPVIRRAAGGEFFCRFGPSLTSIGIAHVYVKLHKQASRPRPRFGMIFGPAHSTTPPPSGRRRRERELWQLVARTCGRQRSGRS